MYLRDVMASLLRRWYLVIVALLLTGLACGYVARAIGPTYQMSASVLLIPPKDPTGLVTNRYLSLGSTGSALQVLARSMSSDPTHKEVLTGYEDADYTAGPDGASSAPMLLLNASAHSPTDARAVLAHALARAPKNLAALQQALGIANAAQIDSQLISEDAEPTFALKPQLRPTVTVGVLLLGLFAALIAGIDTLLSARSRTRHDRPSRRFRRATGTGTGDDRAADLEDGPRGDIRRISPSEPKSVRKVALKAAAEPPRRERRFR